MKQYFKASLTPFLYLIFFAMIGFSITLINSPNLLFLEYILCTVNIVFYCVIVGYAATVDGKKALKIREQNDSYRKVIARTGEDLPIKVHEEFGVWKGYVIGAVACIPTVLLVIIQAIVSALGGGIKIFGVIAVLLSQVVTSFFAVQLTSLASSYFYVSLLIIPFVSMVYGTMYLVGGKKLEKSYANIHKTQKILHGDDE